jgi:hypothetical protein
VREAAPVPVELLYDVAPLVGRDVELPPRRKSEADDEVGPVREGEPDGAADDELPSCCSGWVPPDVRLVEDMPPEGRLVDDSPPDVRLVEDSPPEGRLVEDMPPDSPPEGRLVDDVPVPELLLTRSPVRPPNENPPPLERLIPPGSRGAVLSERLLPITRLLHQAASSEQQWS